MKLEIFEPSLCCPSSVCCPERCTINQSPITFVNNSVVKDFMRSNGPVKLPINLRCGPGLQMSVAKNVSPGDKVVSIDNVNFYLEEKADAMLGGVTIDFGPQGFKLEGLKRSGGCC